MLNYIFNSFLKNTCAYFFLLMISFIIKKDKMKTQPMNPDFVAKFGSLLTETEEETLTETAYKDNPIKVSRGTRYLHIYFQK